jgi:ribosome-binding protein aMBF1 (putative translation factor)
MNPRLPEEDRCAVCGKQAHQQGHLLKLCDTCARDYLNSPEHTEAVTARSRWVQRVRKEKRS